MDSKFKLLHNNHVVAVLTIEIYRGSAPTCRTNLCKAIPKEENFLTILTKVRANHIPTRMLPWWHGKGSNFPGSLLFRVSCHASPYRRRNF